LDLVLPPDDHPPVEHFSYQRTRLSAVIRIGERFSTITPPNFLMKLSGSSSSASPSDGVGYLERGLTPVAETCIHLGRSLRRGFQHIAMYLRRNAPGPSAFSV
jgi:hypothetical protein